MTRKRRRPEGCLYKRGRLWWFKWAGADGRTHYRSSGSSDRNSAESMLRDELSRRDKGRVPSPAPRSCLVNDLLDGLAAKYRIERRRSLDRLLDAFRHLLRLFDGVPAISVTGADILRYADLRRQEGAAPATVNRELAVVRAAYRFGQKNHPNLLETIPYIALLPENNVRKGFAEAHHVETICRHLPPDAADVVWFGFWTGWRKSEILSLRWAQVDLEHGFVRLEPGTTKTGEGRAFPLIPDLRSLLEKRRDLTKRCERAQGRIIPFVFHRSGAPIKSFRRTWTSACRKAGLPSLIFHDLRRSAVRNLTRSGIAQSTAMDLTGHRTPAVFRRYAIKDDAVLREAGEQLARWLRQADRRALGDNRPGISVTELEDRRGNI